MPTQVVLGLQPGRTGAVGAGSASVEVETRSYDLHSKFNGRQAIIAIKDLACTDTYLNSFPLPDHSCTDRICSGDARGFFQKQ